jgi:hypothetical protein
MALRDAATSSRHGRACPGHDDFCLYRRPDLATTFAQPDSRGTSPGMTIFSGIGDPDSY